MPVRAPLAQLTYEFMPIIRSNPSGTGVWSRSKYDRDGYCAAVIFLPLTKYSQAFENKPIRLLSAETGRGFGAWRENIRLLKHRRTTNAYDSN
jgi:hypothetical protein